MLLSLTSVDSQFYYLYISEDKIITLHNAYHLNKSKWFKMLRNLDFSQKIM